MDQSRHALIVANDRYDDQGLRQLRSPAQDALALAEVLGDPQVGDFDVEVLRNEPVHAIRRVVERFFSEGGRDDTLMLHFSCHGLKSESGSLYFAARDTEPRLLEATAVSAQFVRHCMSRTRARRTVLFLDCCYGGAFSRGASGVRASEDVHVLESFGGEQAGGRGWAVITASNSMEYAFEGADLAEGSAPRPSVFTHAVVEGLTTGEADLDADGKVSLDELYDYVFDHVRRQNPNQTPGRTVDMQGDLYLAHSRRRRIVPRPLPQALRRAVEDPDFYTRLGALAELRARMQDTDLSVALGARQALAEMAQNDIRIVSDEARRALAESELRPDPDSLDFGRVPLNSVAPHRPVRLLGPPLARDCGPQPARPGQDWLRAAETPEGLDVSIDTATAGRRSGELRLKGAVGEAVVRVEAEVVPEPAGTTTPPRPPSPPSSVPSSPPPPPPSRPRPPSPTQTAGPAGGPRHTASAGGGAAGRRGRGRPQGGATVGMPRPAAAGTPARDAPPERSLRAPGLAAAALALALVSVATVAWAAVRAGSAAEERVATGDSIDLSEHVHDFGVLPPLIAALITAVAALVLCAYARHELASGVRRPTPWASGTARSLAWTAMFLSVASLALGALMAIAYPITNHFW
ncbi:hypothetical protein QF032_006921 [Streptomyces achromogenes]|uniref:caspase family protein n=1 Tax=Streptomyces achromogenes TaxID=67255 RepID=UPI00277DC888|nr:caspase family protein [Streptomyces achromogenes]MDQ0835077.1 hypothetical protein [Streptomyces achromogenes]